MSKLFYALAGPLILVAMAAPACTRARAEVMPDSPPLDVPAAPPRLVEPEVAQMPPPVGLIDEPARNTPERSWPAPERPEPPRTEPPKVETPANDTAKPEEQRPQAPATLQTVPADQEGQVKVKIRAQLARAVTNLNRVDYRALNSDGKASYDQAKRFVDQAEEALGTSNLVFAATVADKAATLAGQLAGR